MSQMQNHSQNEEKYLCHGFRKFFKTYAQRTMSFEYVEKFLGHTGNWSDAAYSRPLHDWLVEAYLKAVPDLRIYKPVDDQTRVFELSAQMESKDQEVQQLKEQMAKMQQDFKSYDQEFSQKFARYVEWQKGQTKFYKDQFMLYFKQFGPRPLTDKERERLEEFQEQLRNVHDSDNYDDD